MDRLLRVRTKLTKSEIFKVVFINFIFLCVLLLMFEPVEKLDDYRMKFALAGAATGEPSCHLLYSNIFLGIILETLTKIVPSVPWYEAYQYIALFFAFSTMTYLILQKKLGTVGNGIIAILLFVFGYEAYIKLTFSKTAGIVSAVGMIFMLTILTKESLRRKKDLFQIMWASLLIVMGALLRYKVFLMIFFISMVVVLFKSCYLYFDIPKSNRYIEIKKIIPIYCRRLGFLLFVLCVIYGMHAGGKRVFGMHEGWKAYQEYNKLKVELQDYGWPPYEEFYEEYQELGVSKNDYNLWSSKDYSDSEILTMDLLQQIVDLKNKGEKRKIVLQDFFKEYPLYFLQEVTFWPVLFVLIFYCMSKQKNSKVFVMGICFLTMGINFYFYVIGRYGQHHIDVGIWFLIALMIVFFIDNGNKNISNINHLVVPLTVFFIAWFSYTNLTYLQSDTYYGDTRYISIDKAKEFLEYASRDSSHMYVTSYAESRHSYMGYEALEQIPAGIYHNIFCLPDYMYPSNNVALTDYHISNIYRDIVDNNGIYYFQSENSTKKALNTMVNYIREHYNPNAKEYLVKCINGVNVYQICSEQWAVDAAGALEDAPDVYSNLAINIKDKESILVRGSLFKENFNSYNQSAYLEMTDQETGKTVYSVLTQYEDPMYKDVMNGKYGVFTGTYSNSEKVGDTRIEWTETDVYNVILECQDSLYRIPINEISVE